MIRNVLQLTILSVVFFFAFNQCTKEDTADSLPAPNISDTLQLGVSAKIFDSTWLASNWKVNVKNGFINFSAETDTGEVFGFWINNTKPGLYTFGGNHTSFAYFIDVKGNAYFSHGIVNKPNSLLAGGMVNISSINADSISGSFIFTLYCAEKNRFVNISQGAFNNIKYENLASTTIGFQAEIIESNVNSSFSTSSDKCSAQLIDQSSLNLIFYAVAENMFELNIPAYAKGTFPISFNTKSFANYYPSSSKKIFSSYGNENSWGFITITDTSNATISGNVSFKIYNPVDKKLMLVHSGSFKRVKVEKKSSINNKLSCKINDVDFSGVYNVVNTLNNKYKISAFDGQSKARIILYYPLITGKGVVTLSKDKKDAFAVYINNAGKMFISTDGSILIKEKEDSVVNAIFNFESVYGNDEMNASIKEGSFTFDPR